METRTDNRRLLVRHTILALLLSAVVLAAQAAPADAPLQDRADRLLALVNAAYQGLYQVQSEAQWAASTDVSPAHDAAAEAAGKAMAAFNGNLALITEAKALLGRRDALSPLALRQLERVLLNAAEGPMTNPKLVANRIDRN